MTDIFSFYENLDHYLSIESIFAYIGYVVRQIYPVKDT